MPENIRSEADAISLREHLERLIDNGDKQHASDLAALRRELDLIRTFTKEAGEKADKIDVEWRKQANEWRGTVEGIITKYTTSTEVQALEKSLLASMVADRTKVQNDQETLKGGLLAAIGSDRTKSESDHRSLEIRVTKVESWKDNMQGRFWGIQVLTGVVVFVMTQLMRVFFPSSK
jgi:hypothetical protein